MKRELLDNLQKDLSRKEFTIITGARQTGKSTLLHQLWQYCEQKKMPAVFINLENKEFLREFNETPLNLLRYLPSTDKRCTIFIDEVQYLDDPTNFLKLLYDQYFKKIKIIATGSSAFYIDKKFNDSLSGRKKIFFLPTLSFNEYLKFQNKDNLLLEIENIKNNPVYKSTKIKNIEKEYNDYILYGGYPAVVLEQDIQRKIEKLSDLRDSFVRRDIFESNIRNETAFYGLFRILASQIGCLVNVNELSKTLGIDNDTISHYLYVMQKCFHISLVKPYSTNIRNEITKMPKVYLLDSGMINILTNNFDLLPNKVNKGNYWENIYYRQLLEKYEYYNINFWRTASGNEVDFILNKAGDGQRAVEVKYNRASISESKYKKFRELYPEIALSFSCYEPFNENFFRNF